MENQNIKASACIIAYNHENYIAEAIESALSQKTDFSYEIVVCEDHSTDQTREIAARYREKYPDRIKLLINETNLGLIGNWEKSLKSCAGEYIAILEGDDYWTDPLKIQKQVDFLEKNPGCAMATHDTVVVDENGEFIRSLASKSQPDEIALERLLAKGKNFATCSIVFRKSLLRTLPDWFFKMKACDWTLPVMAAAQGKIKYFSETMGAYRKHKKGADYNLTKKAGEAGESTFGLAEAYTLEMSEAINRQFDYKYDKLLRRHNLYWYNNYVTKYARVKEMKQAKKYAAKIIAECLALAYWPGWLKPKRLIKLILVLFSPLTDKFIAKYI